MPPIDTLLFERGDSFYLVGPVAPFEPTEVEVDELAFAEDVRKMAPNEHLWWLRGQYVEGDRANDNGQIWTSETLEIASLTPMLMPVTVMHDPRTAVGLIADAKLAPRRPDAGARIDTTLGLWRHRFPEVADEAAENYRQGTLMQSMECRPAYYDCAECDTRFPRLPDGGERANWCEHLKAGEIASAATTTAARRLGNVCFTGTGLIFGTRGAKGALDKAHLEVLQEEVAEFHERAKSQTRRRPRRQNVETIEIQRSEYDDLKAKVAKLSDFESRVPGLEEAAAKVPDLEKKVEDEETARKTVEDERDELKKKVDEADERARKETLSGDRRSKLGKGFLAKLGDFTRGRLEEQAGSLSDEEWDARLQELEEVATVKRDEGGPATENTETETFTREETARGHTPAAGGNGGSGGNGGEPSPQARRSVVSGLRSKKS